MSRSSESSQEEVEKLRKGLDAAKTAAASLKREYEGFKGDVKNLTENQKKEVNNLN